MSHPKNWDTGAYHLDTIRWLNSYAIVPGLGNLHGRFAFNQSHFTYIAALNFHPFFGHGWSVGNSFLLLLSWATLFDLFRPVFRTPSILLDAHPFRYLPVLFLLPIFYNITVFSYNTFSPSPDFPTMIVQLILMIIFLQVIEEYQRGKTDQQEKILVIIVVATVLVTVKLSNLAFSTVIILILMIYRLFSSPTWPLARIMALCLCIIAVWSLRGVILSGAPLYPTIIGYIPFDWSIPLEEILFQKKVTYAWGRQPHVPADLVLGSWDWFHTWFAKNIHIFKYDLIFTAVFFIFSILFALFMRKHSPIKQLLDWLILLPSVTGILFWFFTSPDPRFAGSLFPILAMSSALLFLSYGKYLFTRGIFATSVAALIVAVNFDHIHFAVKNVDVITAYLSETGWQKIRKVELIEKQTHSGLKVYLPKKGLQTWNAPLPATTYFNPRLSLRKPGDLSSGFTVRNEQYDGTTPYPRKWMHL